MPVKGLLPVKISLSFSLETPIERVLRLHPSLRRRVIKGPRSGLESENGPPFFCPGRVRAGLGPPPRTSLGLPVSAPANRHDGEGETVLVGAGDVSPESRGWGRGQRPPSPLCPRRRGGATSTPHLELRRAEGRDRGSPAGAPPPRRTPATEVWGGGGRRPPSPCGAGEITPPTPSVDSSGLGTSPRPAPPRARARASVVGARGRPGGCEFPRAPGAFPPPARAVAPTA